MYRIIVDIIEVDNNGKFVRPVDENRIIKEFDDKEKARDFVNEMAAKE